MAEIIFLVGDTSQSRHDNHERLPAAFEALGWRVSVMPQESVNLRPDGVRFADAAPESFDLVWLLGMGHVHTFLDRMQLLRLLPQSRFVIPVDALIYRHAKYHWWRRMPETHASNDPAHLAALLAGGGRWVAKPAAGSYGRDVAHVVHDREGIAAIRRLTGNGNGEYCILQRYVPEIERGEKRTLVAGGQLIGTYLRQPGADLRANLAAGGEACGASLDTGERALVESVAAELDAMGIGFAAVDTVYPYLMEVNLANPGGLATLERLYGADPAPAVAESICRWHMRGCTYTPAVQ